MVGANAKIVLTVLVTLAAFLVALPLEAQPVEAGFAPGSVCHAEAGGSVTYAELARQPSRWQCGTEELRHLERVALRFDLRGLPTGVAAPDHLKIARLHFERMDVLAIAADGSTAHSTFGRDDLLPGRNLLEAAVPLPQLDAQPVAIALVVEGAPSIDRLEKAELVVGPPVRPIAGLDQLLAALLCGLLLAPLFYDIGYFRTLRARFPLYHAAFCALAVVQTATLSGLLLMLTDLSLAAQRAISILSFDFMVTASSLFILTFVEKGVFERRHKRLLHAMAGLTAALGLFAVFALPVIGPATGTIYYLGYLFYLAALAVILVRALRKHSRAIRFVLLAHLPLLFVGMVRVAIGLFAPPDFTFDSYWPQNLALAFEVIVTSFAVADRFMIIKRERDRARSEARSLEELTERDALTGLLNRRAIESRFDVLRAEGFTTLAVIDLDRFKVINDTHGHAAGDLVLRCVAAALRPDDDNTLAFRLGGEEFVLLLRGKRTLERAESQRLAITEFVENAAPIPDRVTASMGVVDAPQDSLADVTFETLYSRADRLLYEAKATGRNRTMSERLKVFRPRRKANRRAAAA